jgi:plastocyanin
MTSTKWIRIAAAGCALAMAACGSSNTAKDGGTTTLNNCADSAFTTAGASPTIAFGVSGFTYSPPCLTVSPNTTVTFSGDFVTHPLRAGVAPNTNGTGSPNNPIAAPVSGNSISIHFPTAGNYPYYCGAHYSLGMMGVVRVQ